MRSIIPLRLLGLGVVLLLLAADWPQFLGPKRDGTSTETGLATTWAKGGPPIVWERQVGEGYSGPVVAGARLVLFHRAGAEEVVECLDAAKGTLIWKHGYACTYEDPYGKGNGPRATPVISSAKVYTLGAGGILQCLSFDDGKPLWQRDLARDYRLRPSFFGVGATPLIEGDLLVLNVGAVGAGIVAFNKDTGKEIWKATDQDASYSSPVAATIDGVRHILVLTREGLVSLDPSNGAVRFSKRFRSRQNASVNAATPLVIGDEVFLTASYNTGAALLKVKADGVSEIWANDKTMSSQYDTPVYLDGRLYGIDGRSDAGVAQLRCVELKTGTVLWSQEDFGCASIILADGQLIILKESGEVVLATANPKRYQETARAALLAAPCRAHPALADGRLYARDNKRLVCWTLKKN